MSRDVPGTPGDHRHFRRHVLFCLSLSLLLAACTPPADHPAPGVTDPGVRGGYPGAGGPLPGLTADAVIRANMKHSATGNKELGIQGRPNAHIAGSANISGNDGTITRFGWKAQNKSLRIFSGEAYNVEMGVTNELSPQERDESGGCVLNATPEDVTDLSATSAVGALADIEAFSLFMRFLAPPAPAPENPSTTKGKTLFVSAGCAACHTPSLMTGAMIASGSSTVPGAALSGKRADLSSDLLLRHMGEGLADGVGVVLRSGRSWQRNPG